MIFIHLSDFLINAQVEVLCVTRPSRDLSIVGVATPDYVSFGKGPYEVNKGWGVAACQQKKGEIQPHPLEHCLWHSYLD